MKSQLFKEKVPSELLFNFLEEFAICKDDHYIFSSISFNKAKFHDKIYNFCNNLKYFYHEAKQHYLTRKITYNNFTTIIRQICKSNLITYTSKVKYEKSTYDIEYYIYK